MVWKSFVVLLCCQGNGVLVAMLLVGGGGGACCCHGGRGPEGGGGGWLLGGGGGGIMPTGGGIRPTTDQTSQLSQFVCEIKLNKQTLSQDTDISEISQYAKQSQYCIMIKVLWASGDLSI